MSDPLERAVIGLALTADPAVAIDLGDVRPEHFADLRHAALWDLIARMWANEAVTDPMTVVANLSSIPADERRGVDDDYLLECLASAPVPADLLAHEYAFRLIQAAEHQRLTAALIRAQQLLEGTPDPVEAESLIRSTIDAAAPKSRDAGVALADAVAETVPTLGQATTFTATPWADLNNLIGGWRKGGLYVVGARPGVGKSILGLNAAAGLARTGPVALSTLEMNRREVSVRLLAAAGRINVGHLTGVHDMTDADWLKVPDAQALVSSLPISVDDRTGATVWDVVTHARLLARSGPLAAVVVDYLQLLTTPRGDQRPRHEIVSDQSRQLKVLAGELDCPVIALSQLNRQSEGRAGGTPMLSDLRESGSLEQDADVVMLLNMPMVDDGYGGEAPDTGRLDVIVAKNRQGEVGTVRLQRDGATATLRNLVNSWQAR